MVRFALGLLVLGITVAACSLFGDGEAILAGAEACDAEPGDELCGDFSPHCDAACRNGAPDGTCDAGLFGLESCACSDCTADEDCLQITNHDDVCTLGGDDTCLSEDCDLTGYCYTLLSTCCNADGVCDPLREACNCVDCQAVPHCVDQVGTCAGEATDGTCDDAEPCTCPDCAADARCALTTCVDDGECVDKEACICPDCVSDQVCECDVDDTCDFLNESCSCADCTGTEACAGGVGGAGGGGGDGGAGGSPPLGGAGGGGAGGL